MSFPITCTACHKTFTISDEIYEKKVAGRVVTIKCKSCSQGIRVDGTKGAAGSGSASAPPQAGPAAAPSAEPVWAVDYPDGQDREFTTAEVVAELERGTIGAMTLVWRDGMPEWLELAQVSELSGELARIEAKKAAKAEAERRARAKVRAEASAKADPDAVFTPRAPMPTVTGLGGLPGAESAPPRAKQPSSPMVPPRAQQASSPGLTKPRAQQPSAPVFPKPAAAPPAPAPPVGPAPMAAAALPTPPAFAASPAPAFTPPLPASVAKVVSKPPQVESVPAFPMTPPSAAPAFGALPAVVSDHATIEWPEAKKKTPLILMGVIAAALVIGGIVFALATKEDVPPPTPINAAPPRATPTSTGQLASPPVTTRPGADTASGSDPIAATPGAGFAELFAAGARKAESKGASVSTGARFDPAASKAPLAQAANDAQACKQIGGPTGKVTVMVTFDSSGKASSATITDAPFAGTATGTCISAALKRATVPPFSGLPVTVSKTFSIL